MHVFRITREKYQGDILNGIGAKLYGGRWNLNGVEAIYTASSRALAILEMLAHLDLKDHLPKDRILATIEIPSSLSITEVQLHDLPSLWYKFPYVDETQVVFSDFVRDGKNPVLKVPSALVEEEYNFIINPRHKAFLQIKVIEVRPLEIDKRILPPG